MSNTIVRSRSTRSTMCSRDRLSCVCPLVPRAWFSLVVPGTCRNRHPRKGWVCLSSLGTDKAPIRVTAGVDWRNGNQDPQQSIERIEGVDAIPTMGGEGEASLPTAGWNTPLPEDRKMKSVSETDESYVTME